ncbi:MAG: hypothetical protein K2X42_00930 [Burkholderiaceae bacterium]|nr:hypothetical protein [Burkholderiaceae bacterium]
MSPKFRATAATLWLAGMAAAVAAQQPGPSPAASAVPSSPAASAATRAASYRSAFEGYKAFNEQPVVSWRESNTVVGRIGGWQAYAREGQGGATAGSGAPPAPSAGKSEMPDMPAGHGSMNMAPAAGAVPAPNSPATAGSAPPKAPMKMPVSPAKAIPAPTASSTAAPDSHSGHKKP